MFLTWVLVFVILYIIAQGYRKQFSNLEGKDERGQQILLLSSRKTLDTLIFSCSLIVVLQSFFEVFPENDFVRVLVVLIYGSIFLEILFIQYYRKRL